MKLLITGSKGLTGSALCRMQDQYPDYEMITTYRKEADLINEHDVKFLIDTTRPDAIIHTAAAVGGIGGNMANHGRFFRDNILMNTHIIHYAAKYGVKKLLAFSSVCVFPDDLAVLTEDSMHSGEAYHSNNAYAYAKRMIDVQISAYKSQYGIENYCSIIPSNQFGPNDWFHTGHGHVVPVLMHKLYIAKQNDWNFPVWGDGKSLREFIYIDDVARCCLDLLKYDEIPQRLLVTGKEETSIKEMVEMLCRVADFPLDRVVWETDKPNGQRSRPSDKTLFNQYFPNFKYTSLEDGLKTMWDWFVENYEVARK